MLRFTFLNKSTPIIIDGVACAESIHTVLKTRIQSIRQSAALHHHHRRGHGNNIKASSSSSSTSTSSSTPPSPLPCLATCVVDGNHESDVYIRRKQQTAQKVGFKTIEIRLPSFISQREINDVLIGISRDRGVHGIILQKPLPDHLSFNEAVSYIDVNKDVDGLNPENVGLLYAFSAAHPNAFKRMISSTGGYSSSSQSTMTTAKNQEDLHGVVHFENEENIPAVKGATRQQQYLHCEPPKHIPCTALAVLRTFQIYDIPLQNQFVTVVGTSSIAGRPIAELLSAMGAIVTLCHTRSGDHLIDSLKQSDIVVTACGDPHFFNDPDHFKDGVKIIDVGLKSLEHPNPERRAIGKRKLVGDVDFEKVCLEKASYASSCPGGIGPLGVAILLENTLRAYTMCETSKTKNSSWVVNRIANDCSPVPNAAFNSLFSDSSVLMNAESK